MAEATGNLEVRPLSRVTQMNVDGQGNVTSVTYLDAGGVAREQTARIFVIASYTYENVRLLLLSKSDMFPDGLANNSGMVGKYYFGHGIWSVNGILPQGLNKFAGPQGQGIVIDDFNADNFDHTGLGFIRGTYMFAGNQLTPISGANTLAPGTPAWGSGYKDFLRNNFNHVGSISNGASGEILAYDANFLDLDPDVKDDIGLPVIRITHDIYDNEKTAWAYIQGKAEEIMREMGATTVWKGTPFAPSTSTHAQGGTRMGNDPARSVVDQYCRAHEVPNLFIFGGSVHVTATGFNPTENIMALAWRGSDEIIRQLS